MQRFASVALNLPLRREFTYGIPQAMRGRLELGSRVKVPFGKRTMIGVVVGLDAESEVPASKLKDIVSHFTEIPPLPACILEFTRLMAGEYACSWGSALEAALPGSLKRGASRTLPAVQLARDEEETRLHADEIEEKLAKQSRCLRAVLDLGSPVLVQDVLRRTGLSRSPIDTLVKKGWLAKLRLTQEDDFLEQSRLEHAPRHDLTEAQEGAVRKVLDALATPHPGTFLLHGVTGSGKTEVYLRILEEVHALGRGAIILVPEISLTPQTVGRFLSRFPDVAVLHSSLTDATRARQWLRLARGEVKIVVGARSALFAPIQDLGLIVVDEEHEQSFKQQNTPRYHARDMAVLRGRLAHAAVIMGSATPSLESWVRAKRGARPVTSADGKESSAKETYQLLELPLRAGAGRMPHIMAVDMRHEKPLRGRPRLLSHRLENLMAEKLRLGEQIILFLNRRGLAPVLFCNACGETIKCGHCDIPMTWHSGRGRLICHYCMEEMRRPELCPSCHVSPPVHIGSGTEKVEDQVKRRFPDAVVARMDSDTMTKRDSYEKVLGAFRKRDIDILIGTQMIAKGLDFPEVTLVGVISADIGLFLPDFRASERCFQLLSQVAGRAGRGEREGLVLFQTLCPEAEPVMRAVAGDYEGFVTSELEARRKLRYPPYARLIRIIVESPDSELAWRKITELAKPFRAACRSQEGGTADLAVLGPAPAPLARIRGRYRFHLVLKVFSQESFALLRPLFLDAADESGRNPKVLIDVDSVSML